MKQILTFTAYDQYVEAFTEKAKEQNGLYQLWENIPSIEELDELEERRPPNYPLFLVWILALIETAPEQSEHLANKAKQLRKRINQSLVLIDEDELMT